MQFIPPSPRAPFDSVIRSSLRGECKTALVEWSSNIKRKAKYTCEACGNEQLGSVNHLSVQYVDSDFDTILLGVVERNGFESPGDVSEEARKKIVEEVVREHSSVRGKAVCSSCLWLADGQVRQ